MATYTLRIIQNGKSKSGTFNDNQRAQLPADPNTEYRIYDDNGNLITHPLVERQGDDLLVYANKVNDGTPELILTDYFNKNPVLNADYVADAGNTLMTNDKLAAIVPVMASEVLVKAITVGAALVIGGVILSLFDDNDGNGSNNNQNTKTTDLAAPAITIAPIPTITNKNGTTTLTGTMALNNENVDSAAVTLVVNGTAYPATISPDNQSWTAEVPNDVLAQTEGSSPIVAHITISKNGVSKTANNAENTATPVSDTENVTSFTVDTTVGTPVITIQDVPNIVKGQDTDSQIYTISGTLDNIDADATPTVTVKINDTVITQTVNVAADKKTWSVDVEGKLLAEKLGDNQTVVASVIVVDTNGNTATAQTPADLYNVSAPAQTLNTPYITVTPLPEINNTNGSTPVSGTLDLNNENLDKATVTVSINGGAPVEAKISDDKKSWTVDVDNATLIGDKNAPHNIVATVDIAKGEQAAQSTNTANDRDTDPAVNNGSFTVDNTISTPEITINDVPNIEKGKQNDTYPISGSLKNIDADATPTVIVTVNGKLHTATVSADKKTWSVNVSGSDLAAKVGDNQKVTATVSVKDGMGNTATAAKAAEDAYNVTEPAPAAALNKPYITVAPLAEIKDKTGSTHVSGTLDLNNENLDKATVTVSINGGTPVEAKISDDKKSWTVDVDNATLIGDKNAPHNIVATVNIAKGEQAAQSTNTANDRDTDPAVNNGSFTVDNTISTPEITINDVPNIEKGKQNTTYPISGSLKNIDADATPTVTVSVNGTAITTPVTISADKKTWSVNVSGSELAKTVGDNQKVTATVSVEDKMGNKATAAQAAEDAYNVTEPTSVTPTPTPPTPAALNEPYITVMPLAEINDKNGKTKLQGLLDLKNEGVSETVTVSINDGEPITVPAANISADKKSWFLEVDNATLIGDKDAPHTVLATVTVSKDGHQPESANNSTSEDNPQINTVDFTVDTAISTPEITINDVPNMEQGKQNDTYPISGSLNNIDADATPTVTVSVNGTAITTPVTISADKKTWNVNVSGSDLAKTVGDNQKVTATVSVEDKMGNKATAAKAAEDVYNVTEPAPVTPPTPIEPSIIINQIERDVIYVNNPQIKHDDKTISGTLMNVPSDTKVEVVLTVNGKNHKVNLNGDKWSATIPADDLKQRGEQKVIAKINLTDANGKVTEYQNEDSFVVIVPEIQITSPKFVINDLNGKTTISGTFNADFAENKVITINIGDMEEVTLGGFTLPTSYTNTVTSYKSSDTNSKIQIDETNKTWSIEVDNAVLAHMKDDFLGIQAELSVSKSRSYDVNGNNVGGSSVSGDVPAQQDYRSEVEAPKSSPLIISNLVDDDNSNLASISSVIDVSVAENHSVSGSNGVQDTFVFSKVLDGNIAQIANFNADEDKLQLNSEVFTALSNTMSDFADYVQYNAATGALSYDADGTGAGAATQLAQLSKDLEIDQSNFIIA